MPRYPTPGNVEIRPQARTFILFPLTLAYPMFGAGFLIGGHNYLFLGYDDFEVAGNMLPGNCSR